MKHDLTLVDEKYRHAVKVLLEWQDSLSDGYGWYCEMALGDDFDYSVYNDDRVLAVLAEIAKEIIR